MKSKVFDFREDESHCLQCGHKKFTTIEWSEFDEVEMKNHRDRVELCKIATMVSVGPMATHFSFKMCAKCGSLHKTYQPAEWKDKYIPMSDTADLIKRYDYWRDKGVRG